MASRWARRAALIAALAGCVGCRGPKDPILALLADLKKAAESRDAGAIAAKLTEDFHGGRDVRLADVRSMLQRYFLAYEKVNIEVYEVEVERDQAKAKLRFRADFNGRPLRIGSLGGLLPPSAMFRFELGLRQAEAGWRVAQADWEEIAPAAAR
jgi:hypothetical protein